MGSHAEKNTRRLLPFCANTFQCHPALQRSTLNQKSRASPNLLCLNAIRKQVPQANQTQVAQAFAEALCSKPLLYPCISKRSCTERNETENERQTLEIIQGTASTSSQFADPDGLRLPGADGGWLLSAAGRCTA